MSVANLSIVPVTLPAGYCYPSSPQDLLNKFAESVVQFQSASFTTIVTGASAPAATDRDKLWFNTNDSRFYAWNSGLSAWTSKHRLDPASSERMWWEDTLVNLQTHDGGDTNASGDASGPMWEEDTAYQGRFPLHVGTLQPSATAVALGGTGGVDQVTVAQVNLPAVTITVDTAIVGNALVTGDGGHAIVGQTYGSTPISGNVSACDATDTSGGLSGCYYTLGQTRALGSGTALNVTNPYRAGYWCKRTARIYYKA